MGPGQAIGFCSLCSLISRLELFTQPFDLIHLPFPLIYYWRLRSERLYEFACIHHNIDSWFLSLCFSSLFFPSLFDHCGSDSLLLLAFPCVLHAFYDYMAIRMSRGIHNILSSGIDSLGFLFPFSFMRDGFFPFLLGGSGLSFWLVRFGSAL